MQPGSAPVLHKPALDELGPDAVQVVARTPALAEVRIVLDSGQPVTIGTVRLDHDAWCWAHNDGEQSSPIAQTRLAAARALAGYHRAYKPRPAATSLREKLAVARVR